MSARKGAKAKQPPPDDKQAVLSRFFAAAPAPAKPTAAPAAAQSAAAVPATGATDLTMLDEDVAPMAAPPTAANAVPPARKPRATAAKRKAAAALDEAEEAMVAAAVEASSAAAASSPPAAAAAAAPSAARNSKRPRAAATAAASKLREVVSISDDEEGGGGGEKEGDEAAAVEALDEEEDEDSVAELPARRRSKPVVPAAAASFISNSAFAAPRGRARPVPSFGAESAAAESNTAAVASPVPAAAAASAPSGSGPSLMQLLSSGGGGASLSSPAAVAASPFRSRLSSEKLSLPSTVSEGSLDPKAHREYVDKMMAREMSVESRSNPAQFNSYESSFVLGGSGGGGSGGGGGAAAAAAAAATSSSSPNATSGGGFHLPASFDLVRWSGVAGTTASSKFTPLETQVLALKQRHPDVLLLVEVGYKFRFFGRDAEVAAHLLDIYAHPSHHLLTASIPTFRLYIHVKRLLEAGLKVGVVRQTESAASKKAEKQGAAAAAAKDGKKKGGAASSTGPLFTRGISELYTKATSVPELGDEGEGMLRSSVPSRYLLCLFEEPAAASYGELDAASRVRCSIVGVDPTTGEVVWDAFETGFLRTELHTRLAQLAPAEVLVSSRPNTLSANSASMLVAFAEAQAAAAGSAAATEAVRLEKLDGKKFKFEYNEAAAIISRFLDDAQEQATAMGGGKQQEQPRDIEVLDGDEDESKGGAGAAASAMPTTSTPTTLESLNLPKGVVICLGQLIPYLRSFGLEGAFRSLVAARAAPSSATAAAAAAGAPTSAASSSPSFHRFRLASQALQLDALALHNLEVVRSQEGQAQGSLLWLLSHTKTSFGARKLREMVLHPLANQEAIVARLDAVDELLSADTTWPSNLTPVMHQLPDLERGLARVQYGQCKPLEFLRLLEALQKVVHAYPDARTIASMRASLFRDLFASVDFPALKSTVQGLLASLNPAAVEQDRKADFFADPSLFPEIAQAKRDILAIEAELAAHLVAARKLLGPDYARLEYLAVNNIEFLIEVKQADVKRVPKSWVQQNATKVKVRYHPPEVSAALDRLLLAREHLVNVSNAAWRTFLASFSSHYALLRPCIELLGTLDCLLSLAVVAALPGYVRPDILDSTAAASSSAETGSGDSGGAGGGGAVLDVKGGRHPMIEAAWMGASGGSFVPNDIEMNAAGPRFYVISGANMGGKCWGRDTRLMLHNGRSMSVQSIVQRMQRGESVELMGDDGTPRRTILGTQTIGNTADNGAGAATYRIMSDNSARDTWTCNNLHILVLKFATPPSKVFRRSDSCFFFTTLECVGGVQRADGVWEDGIVQFVTRYFACEDDAELSRAKEAEAWRPLMWQCTVDAFLRCTEEVRHCARMFQPTQPLPFAQEYVSLREHLKDALKAAHEGCCDTTTYVDARLTPSTVELAAWLMGLWIIDGSLSTAAEPSISHPLFAKRLADWRDAVSCGDDTTASDAVFLHLLRAFKFTADSQIPHALLTESTEVRMHLLAGVLDAAGSTVDEESGQCIVSVKSARMHKSFIHLVRGLGFSAQFRTDTSASANDACATIAGPLDTVPTVMPLKRSRLQDTRSSSSDDSCDGFSIEKAAHADYFGFQIDGHGRCLMDDFVVTHNSTYIRSMALIVILAHIGSYVPADSARLSVFDAVHTRMGARDALAAGQSTFHVELSETNQILRTATPRSLVILDELGRGTSTADGVAIAHATSEYILTHVKACTLFVTHYPLLARLQDTYPHLVRNFHMAYVEEAPPQPSAQVDPISGEPVVIAPVPSITFLFKLAPGPAPSSFGLNVARMAHVSETVLQRAALMAQRMRQRNQQQQRRRERDAQKQAWNLLKQVLQPDDVADEEVKETVQRINDLRLALPAAT